MTIFNNSAEVTERLETDDEIWICAVLFRNEMHLHLLSE